MKVRLSVLLELIHFQGLVFVYRCFDRERACYFKDPYNYFDWIGLLLTFVVLPLRLLERKEQWILAAIGFLFNFLRLFKFSCVTR